MLGVYLVQVKKSRGIGEMSWAQKKKQRDKKENRLEVFGPKGRKGKKNRGKRRNKKEREKKKKEK